MSGWRDRGSKALKQFKAFAHSTRRYPREKALADHVSTHNLLYAANPVYIEVTQGGTSPIRGFAALVWLQLLLACGYGVIAAYGMVFDPSPQVTGGWRVFGVIMGLVMLAGTLLPLLMLFFSFFTPTDAVVRFDRKRQMVYKWSGQGLIEIPWSRLTPVVQGMATSPMQASKTYRALFVDYAANGEPRCTQDVPHLMLVGQPSGGEQGALYFLEYVRRYMEDGWDAVPRPRTWLRHRPRWRAMFNFVGMADAWAEEERAPTEEGRPWWLAALFGVGSCVLFPMQVTNWLALQVAPRPRWPRSLKNMHADDLAAIGYLPDGRRAKARLQGVVAERDGDEAEAACRRGEPSGWLDRLAALITIPMIFLSPLLVWIAGFGYLPFFQIDLGAAFVWSGVLGAGATAIALLSLRYVMSPLRA